MFYLSVLFLQNVNPDGCVTPTSRNNRSNTPSCRCLCDKKLSDYIRIKPALQDQHRQPGKERMTRGGEQTEMKEGLKTREHELCVMTDGEHRRRRGGTSYTQGRDLAAIQANVFTCRICESLLVFVDSTLHFIIRSVSNVLIEPLCGRAAASLHRNGSPPTGTKI